MSRESSKVDLMVAATQAGYRGPTDELLTVTERPVPVPGKGEVLVAVQAAALSRGVWHLAVGRPYAARLAFGLCRPRNSVPGMDLAGTVVGVGPEVTAWVPGDQVLGAGRSTWASYCLARADRLVRRPEGLSVPEAAALPDSGCTAWHAVHRHGRVAAGEEVLVIGASGGVGAYAVQLAAHAGARVTGVASAAKHDAVRGWGAAAMLNYRSQSLADAGRRFDVVIDLAGNRSVRELRAVLADRGRLVIAGGEEGGPILGGQGRQLRAAGWALLTRQRMGGMVSSTTAEVIGRLLQVQACGGLRPTVTRSYPLAEAGVALADLERGGDHGQGGDRPLSTAGAGIWDPVGVSTPEPGLIGRLAGAVTGKVADVIPPEVILDHLDLDDLLDRIDVDHLLDRIDVNRLLDRIDVDRLLARADVNALLAGLDLEAVVRRAGIPDIVAEATGSLAGRTLDIARRQVVGLDAVLAGIVDRLLRRRRTPPRGPEALAGPSVTGRYAGVVSRGLAALIDLGVVLASWSGGAWLAGFLLEALFDVRLGEVSGLVATIALVTWGAVYVAASTAVSGRTIGKAVVGLKVVSRDGRPVRLPAAGLRVLVFPLSTSFLALGLLLVAVRRDRRGLHDLLVGTAVVYDWGDRPAELPGPLAAYLHAREAG